MAIPLFIRGVLKALYGINSKLRFLCNSTVTVKRKSVRLTEDFMDKSNHQKAQESVRVMEHSAVKQTVTCSKRVAPSIPPADEAIFGRSFRCRNEVNAIVGTENDKPNKNIN